MKMTSLHLQFKEKGNACYKKGDFENAVGHYTEALGTDTIDHDGACKVACLGNRAQCLMKLSRWSQALDDVKAVLKEDSSNEKALYRQSICHQELGKLDEAFISVNHLLKLYPKNQEGRALAVCLRGAIEKEKEMALQTLNVEEIVRGITSAMAATKIKEEGVDDHLKRLHASIARDIKNGEKVVAEGGIEPLVRVSLSKELGEEQKSSALRTLCYLLSKLDQSWKEKVMTTIRHGSDKFKGYRDMVMEDQMSKAVCRLFSCCPHADVLSALVFIVERLAQNPVHGGFAHTLDAFALLAHAGAARSLVSKQSNRLVLDTLFSVANTQGGSDVSTKMLLAIVSQITMMAAVEHEQDENTPELKALCIDLLSGKLTSDDFAENGHAFASLAALFQAKPKIAKDIFTGEGVFASISASLDRKLADVRNAAINCIAYAVTDNVTAGVVSENPRCVTRLAELLGENSLPLSVKTAAVSSLVKLCAFREDLRDDMLGDGVLVMGVLESCGLVGDGQEAPSIEIQKQGVELLAIISVHKETKKALVSSKTPIGQSSLDRLASVSSEDASARFGIAASLYNLTSSEETVKEKMKVKSADMDLSPDQMEQLQKLGALPGQKQNPVTFGSEALASKSRKWLLDAGGVRLLSGMAGCAKAGQKRVQLTEPTMMMFADTLRYIGIDQQNRGAMIQQGALPNLLSVLAQTKEKDTRESASQCLAQLFITTNPNLVSDSICMDSVKPLIALTESTRELLNFEAAMALTNLATKPESRSKIYAEGGWSKLQNLIFSENEMVRRAGMEALANMVNDNKVLEKLASGKGRATDIRLFVALSKADDLATAKAASGALAMIAAIPEICEHIVAENGHEAMCELAKGKNPELQHRAIVALHSLAETDLACVQGIPSIKQVVKKLSKSHNTAIKEAAVDLEAKL